MSNSVDNTRILNNNLADNTSVQSPSLDSRQAPALDQQTNGAASSSSTNESFGAAEMTSPPPNDNNSNSSIPEMERNSNNNSNSRPLSAFRFTRDIIERRALSAHEQTRNWRDNLSNVFMEFRPLVQQAQNVNNSSLLSSWLPTNSRPVHSRQTDLISDRIRTMNLNGNGPRPPVESVIINFDANTSGGASVVPTPNFGHPTTSSNDNQFPRLFYHNQNLHNHHQPPHHHNHHHPHTSDGDMPPGASNTNGNSPNGGRNTEPRPHRDRPPPHQHNQQDNALDGPVTEAFAQIPEARTIMTTLNRYTPYLFILLVKSCYDHLDGILDFFSLFITFSHVNWVVRQEIAKQHQRKVFVLLRELFYIVLVSAIIGFLLERKHIFLSLIFTPTTIEPFTLRNLLFSVGITDLILKLMTVGIKIIITLMPPTIIEYKGRGRIYLMTEALSQFIRALAPIQPWLVYLLDSYTGSEKIMGVLLSAAYMVAKGTDLLSRAKFCKRSLLKLLQKVSFGVTPTKEQMQSVGGQCPICHDDFDGAVMLECSHIFCELCVGTWFDREQTCPLCRAKVVDDTSWRDGSTTFFVQFY